MRAEVERHIKFTFPQAWHVMRYDDSSLHQTIMMRLQHTHAVDFLCCHENGIMFLEVKRFSEKPFESSGNDLDHFINEVCGQFRDSLCGVSVAKIMQEQSFTPYYETLFSQEKPKRKLTLFIELENIVAGKPRNDVKADILQKLKQRFVPMGFAVRVVDAADLSNSSWKAEVLPC